MEDDDWKKLSLEDRCVNKLWKARVNGYEEVTKLFQQIDDEKSPEFGKYLGLIKKFVVDSNAMGQEKGLEATLAFVENYANAGKTVGEVMAGIVTKCIAAPKTRTRELAGQITLMYIEIEKHEIVQEELIKGMDQKNPKIVAACINTLTTALKEFGSKVVNVKPLVKKIPALFSDRDKGVRDEARAMTVEIYKWIGPALKSQLNSLQAVQVTELETEFKKLEGEKVVPIRYLRSQQEKQVELAAETVEVEDNEEEDVPDVATPMDPYELADPVDILSKLPKNFYEQIEAKKWQERKEVLEVLENLVKTPKLENGDYGDLVRALKKMVQKDANVVVTALAVKCLAGIAKGLKKRFQPYGAACIPTLLEKFKEKKQNVVIAIREAVDAIYPSVSLEAITEDVLEILNNKNPSVKSETSLFLARAFTKTYPNALNKKLLKAYTAAFIKNINESDPGVRDSSAEALGTLMKLVGEKAIGPFLAELEKDNLKMTKIKECCDKAVILVAPPPVKKPKAPAPTKSSSTSAVKSTAQKSTKQPASGSGDERNMVTSDSSTGLDNSEELCDYKDVFQGEMITQAFKTGSPTLRSELWAWLAEKLPKVKTVPKEEMMTCIPHLFASLEDKNSDVRKNAQEAVVGVMIHLSYESLLKQTDKLKPTSKTIVVAALDKAKQNLPAKSASKIKQPSEEKETKAVRGTKPVATSKNAVKPKGRVTSAKAVPARKKEDDIDTSPLMTVNNLKHQRTIDETKLRVLKWNFTTPREEFVELLTDQMTAANINRTLMTNMFHSDFKYHIKAIDSLMEDLPDSAAALISNLDLILKWITLRFFDTNPSVLLKSLEYLHSVFNALIENKYHMLDNEGSAFIPYLVLKIGDPKDAVRNGVRALFRQITNIFPISKLFSYVMEGLKSKNARQRAECLEVLGSIIEDHGINVCLPSPAACLKEIAKQISDRDNSVRNAALNCIVQAYYIVENKTMLMKMIGHIADKDMSLLEERIKRAKKPSKPDRLGTPINTSPQRENLPPSPVCPPTVDINGQIDEDDMEDDIPIVTLPSQLPPTPVQANERSGPFKLDQGVVKHLDSSNPPNPDLQLQEFDLDFLKDDVKVPSLSDTIAKVTPMAPPKPILPNESFSRTSLGGLRSSPRLAKDIVLEKHINNMASSDSTTSLKAMDQMQEILQSNKASTVIDYEDQFMTAIATQLKILHPQDPRENSAVCKGYRSLLTAIDSFYTNRELGRKVTVDVLKNIINLLIMLLVDAKLENCPSGEAYIRVVNLHCVKIIERSDHSNTLCALIKLLYECVSSEVSFRQTDLVMKCLWRVIKIMPNWSEDIDYDRVLYEIHIFLKDFPSTWWKNKPIDTPLRTVKTILHSMAKMKGGQLVLHLGKIPNTGESELESYIQRLLKSLKLEAVKQTPPKVEKQEPKKTVSRSVHTMLTDIFQKISNKGESKEGFNLLYDFMREHPETDLDPFLQKSSPIFQEYINNGLKNVELTRKNAPAEENVVCKEAPVAVGNGDGRGPEYWEGRLQMWDKLWNNEEDTGSHE